MIDPKSDVLVIVDMQHDFLPRGALAVADGDAIIPGIRALAERFDHLVLTQDWHPPGHLSFASSHAGRAAFSVIDLDYGPQVLWPDHCVQGTQGAEIHPAMRLDAAELIIRKGYRVGIDSYSAFLEADRRTPTGLAGYLRERGLSRVYLCGLALDFCVGWSALDARAFGFDAIVVEDLSRAIDADGSLQKALADMDRAGVTRVTSGAIS
ncbi:nicotinamidase/pyrazinamidase [Devosia enhydra]|uniref:Nicotinamidase n=1 Tax=Devosia enhydra TaxID=665118 RepID=A0A1K2HZ27_9HYPH|nr:bifunctional nicotinamidase/pyrazinamidase [Devosia enhydra]SFZ85001.1 nicotinamidase/pyrazinamidase [Devosia enhydra]